MEWQGWSAGSGSRFCKSARDRPVLQGYVIFVTEPELALEYWEKWGFTDMVAWAEEGYPGAHKSARPDALAFWILSPDSKGG